MNENEVEPDLDHEKEAPRDSAPATASFAELGVKGPWVERLASRGIANAAPIQAVGVPALLAGSDAVIRSRTGTGKTLAFLLPALEKIDPTLDKLQAVVLTPTAELAMQIAKEASELVEGTKLRTLALIGGASLQRQLDKLKTHPQLVVGTPGRIQEILTIKKLKMSEVRLIVLDEADQTFALGAAGSGGEAERILAAVPASAQRVFCSATMPEAAAAVVAKWTKNAVWVEAEPQGEEASQRLPSTVTHSYVVSEERDRIDTVRRLLRTLQPKAAMLFVNQTESIAEVEAKLQYHGLQVEAIYGDQPKQERTAVMRRFRSGKLKLLLATDVAARGLDAADVTHVIHVDPPLDAERYLHRAGRTGRMGRRGESVLVLTPNRTFIASKFAEQLGIEIKEKKLQGGELKERRTYFPPTAPAPASRAGERAGARPTDRAARQGERAGTRPTDRAARPGERSGARPTDRAVRPGERSGTRPTDRAARPGERADTRPTDRAARPGERAGTRPTDRAARPGERAGTRPTDRAARPDERAGTRPTDRAARPGERADTRPTDRAARSGERAGTRPTDRAARPGERNGKNVSIGAARPVHRGAKPAARTGKAPAAAPVAKERARDKKNKGAPRWLKDKREGNGGESDGGTPKG
ncbi:DEAD/DEAH box helicase [Paenibacillus sp.]|uniref:DEAD/DEAH box helicase n=1 Tax=Paenibacillus sp. TaxID=58172 RepID=UPI0028122976|nr:DEAD/DEAH box helicase [Paenibacillus sp.]